MEKEKGKKGKLKGKKGFGGKNKGKDGKDAFKSKGRGKPSQANVASTHQPSTQEEPNTGRNLTKKKAGDIRVNGQVGQLLINNIKKVTMASTMILMIGTVVGHIL